MSDDVQEAERLVRKYRRNLPPVFMHHWATDAIRVLEQQAVLIAQLEADSYRASIESLAAKSGWDKNSGEGALEFLQRKCYQQGAEDAGASFSTPFGSVTVKRPVDETHRPIYQFYRWPDRAYVDNVDECHFVYKKVKAST